MKNLPDLWEGCYDGEHRKGMSPQQFKETFCANCLNSGCRNSKAAGLKWIQRMLTQEDRLLDNPQFADPNDPQYRAIAEQDFQNMIRQALAIEVSSRKGDWSVPTEAEIGVAAAEMVGMVPPSAPAGFVAPDPNEPQPPERLVDEVQEYDLGRETPNPTEGGLPEIEVEVVDHSGEERRKLTEPWKAEVEETRLANMASDPPRVKGEWRIRGDTGTIYDVTLGFDGEWECSCPSRENPCKHARDIQLKLSRLAPEPETPAEPQNPTRPAGPASFVPRRMNTTTPNEGVMIGGGEPPPPPNSDPWAVPPTGPKERVIPVGGRVSFGGGKKKG